VASLDFFGLTRTDESRWRMPVVRSLISGTGALFGGAGLGAGIEVAELLTGRSVTWATAQYLNYAPEGTVLDLEVHEVVRGNQVSQVRVLCSVDGREIITVIGSFGHRPVPLDGQWAVRPEVPPPADCPPRPMMDHHEGTISSRLEMKLASARSFLDFPGPPSDTGTSALWVRFPGLTELRASGLAIIGDFVPFGIGQALGERAGGNSLDNTLRVARLVPTDWVLADVRIHAVHGGFGHGLVHLWAEDGTLLGTASQSTMVRAWREAPPPAQELK
jgi:acyl-CoA thioesterase